MRKVRKLVATLCMLIMFFNVVGAEGIVKGDVVTEQKVEMIADNVLYSGVSGTLNWSITDRGVLTIRGVGDFAYDTPMDDSEDPLMLPEWLLYADIITSAVVDVSDISSAGSMFDSLYNLEEVNFLRFTSTSNENFSHYMFYGCENLKEVDLSSWKGFKIVDVEGMFYGCSNLISINFGTLDFSKVSYFLDMFYGCSSLTMIKTPINVIEDIELPEGYWYDKEDYLYSTLPKELDNSIEIFTEDYKPPKKRPAIEINGYQISSTVGGFRTIYSVSDPNSEVVSAGLIYGLEDFANYSDMTIDSSNAYVYDYEATKSGEMNTTFSELEATTSYAMTMTFGECSNKYFTAPSLVRAYAKLSNGKYIYSDVMSYTIYDVADEIYTDNLKNSKEAHDYLYTTILSKVTPDYKVIEFDGNNALVTP